MMMQTKKELLKKMLDNRHLPSETFLKVLLNEGINTTASRKGFLYETVFQILILLKCVVEISYTELYDGQPSSLKKVDNIMVFMKSNIKTRNNPIDISLKLHDTLIVFSCKYNKKYGETDVSKIHRAMTKNGYDNYKVALIVKDSEFITKHKYHDKKNTDKIDHEEIQLNKLLFDSSNAIRALGVFSSLFSDNTMEIDEFIEFINGEYFLSPRRQLVMKLHQKMSMMKFIDLISQPRIKSPYFCLAHKPRSGKSITLLSISNYLIKNGYPKILFLTSVPATIDSFVETIDNFVDFSCINYVLQKDVDSVTETFRGILLCSTEYLKMDKQSIKSNFLKRMNFDVVIIDESHQGSSNDKTREDILDVNSHSVSLLLNSKITIFASGTSQKTQRYYRIPKAHVFEWEMEDESYMKQLNKTPEVMNLLVSRHGNKFLECLNDNTLNKDYSLHPTQVLMKHSISSTLIDDINTYNSTYGTDFGYNCASLFALSQTTNEKGERDYKSEFEICSSGDGEEIMKSFLETIISPQRMFKSVMKQIEKTQTHYGSRKSSVENPLLFLVYLPVNTGNNTISKLQETLKNFLEEKRLWTDYQVEYSNSIGDTGDFTEKYNEYIKTIMRRTKTNRKRGCILLLGNKGTVGITYRECDVTISLDSGHNLDTQKQKYSRALTEATGKTIGINVDMNVQRTYSYILDMIHKHRKSSPTKKSNAEILQYLFENNIFLFDPQQIENGNMTTTKILSYYETECDNMLKSIDDSYLLDGIECNDDMRDMIKDFHYKSLVSDKINKELEGENLDCPQGGTTNIKELDIKNGGSNIDGETETKLGETEEEKIEEMVNKTCELCKQFLFPLMALISRIYHISDFKEIFTNEITLSLIMSLLKDKIDLDLIKSNMFIQIMNTIIDMNDEIVNNIREIYSTAPSNKLRSLIEKHFIPSQEEKKKNAEVPTPVKLVDEMLEIIPLDFWKTPKKVFEPCCGKGNFVLGIFDKFYNGLEELYPDYEERCKVIITECLNYADITPLNVFITTEILKCHVQSYCGLEELDYEFHGFVGDTLKMSLGKFDAVIGNPPYNDDSGNKGKGHTLWTKFIESSLTIWLDTNGYLLFVNPSLWRQPDHPLQILMKTKQIIYLKIHGEKDGLKMFKCNTRYDIYLIQNKPYHTNTTIKTQDGVIEYINLREWSFIPNYNFSKIQQLTNIEDEKVNMLYSRSDYASDKKWTKREKSDGYSYPVVYSVNRANTPTFIWSEINSKVGHYGHPKVIFGSGATGFIVDKTGDYACSEFCTGIIDDVENLETIAQVLNSAKFKDIILATSVSKAEINRKILKHFKKDFWKEFV